MCKNVVHVGNSDIMISKEKFEFIEMIMKRENSVNVKTIIVDLDRTLLRTDKTISSYTVAVLKKMQKKCNWNYGCNSQTVACCKTVLRDD